LRQQGSRVVGASFVQAQGLLAQALFLSLVAASLFSFGLLTKVPWGGPDRDQTRRVASCDPDTTQVPACPCLAAGVAGTNAQHVTDSVGVCVQTTQRYTPTPHHSSPSRALDTYVSYTIHTAHAYVCLRQISAHSRHSRISNTSKAYTLHIASSMLQACCRHVAGMLQACCRHVAGMLQAYTLHNTCRIMNPETHMSHDT
jgi:hypothetical protein